MRPAGGWGSGEGAFPSPCGPRSERQLDLLSVLPPLAKHQVTADLDKHHSHAFLKLKCTKKRLHPTPRLPHYELFQGRPQTPLLTPEQTLRWRTQLSPAAATSPVRRPAPLSPAGCPREHVCCAGRLGIPKNNLKSTKIIEVCVC